MFVKLLFSFLKHCLFLFIILCELITREIWHIKTHPFFLANLIHTFMWIYLIPEYNMFGCFATYIYFLKYIMANLASIFNYILIIICILLLNPWERFCIYTFIVSYQHKTYLILFKQNFNKFLIASYIHITNNPFYLFYF